MSIDYGDPHCDDDDVSLLALGESAASECADHLRTCPDCTRRVLDMRAVVDAARPTDADLLAPAPIGLWERIAAEAFEASDAADQDPDPPQQPGKVVPLVRRRRWTAIVASAAAASGLIIGGAAVWFAVSGAQDRPVTVAAAQLVRPDTDAVMGSATLQRTAAGMALAVQAPQLPAPDGGYYEVWMATPDTVTMVAVGTINPGESAVFALPAAMDTGAFPVVDISLEQFDGNTGHSSVSVARAVF